MNLMCIQCASPIVPCARGMLPPWCGVCGVDLKSCPPQQGHTPDAGAGAATEGEWRERFGSHNIGIGLLLFAWATIITLGPPQSGGDKVLASHKQLNAIVSTVQIVTLVNGVALVVSGVGLRRRWRWGYPLAVACAIVSVVAGGVFFGGFQHLDLGPTLEHGVARLSFVRYHLNLLIGLVDGLGLLWFLSKRYPPSPPSQDHPRQPSSLSKP
jgi:hypothetical protein